MLYVFACACQSPSSQTPKNQSSLKNTHASPTPSPNAQAGAEPGCAEAACAEEPFENTAPREATPGQVKAAEARCARASTTEPATSEACVWLAAHHTTQGRDASAAELFQKACEQGAANGCAGLGSLLYRGGSLLNEQAVLRDPERAFIAWEKGCELGSRVACYQLSQALLLAASSETERETAGRYAQRACELGLAQACSAPEAAQSPP